MSDRAPETLPTACANRLLATLHTEHRDQLIARMEPVQLSRGQTLYEGDAVPLYTYFPTSGLTSILAVTPRGEAVGIAAVGNHGVVGWPLSFPGSTHQVVVEVPGRAYRMRSDVLRAVCERTDALPNVLLAHTQHVLAQISRSVVCHRFHTVPERLASWLLAVCDHTHTNRLRLTQVGIARVLGIQRTGVSAAASELKNAGVIWYQQGRLVIVNRQRLEREACECYRANAVFRGASSTRSTDR